MNPTITIIIPVFNSEKYINACLSSVAMQDYEGSVECIIVDDGSVDGSVDVINTFIAGYHGSVNFSLLQHNENRKQSAARNTGLDNAHGDYVFFVDSDDLIEPHTLKSMTETLSHHPGVEMVQGGVFSNESEIYFWLNHKSWQYHDLMFTDNRMQIVDMCSQRFGMIPVAPVCKLISRRFLEEHCIRFVEGMFYEDDVFLVNIAKHLTSVAFCHQNLYYYRVHEQSTMNGGKNIYYNDLQRMWNEIFRLFDKDFHPSSLLRRIEKDISFYYNRASSFKVKKMLMGIKLRLFNYCPAMLKLRIIIWTVYRAPFLFIY